MDLSLYLARVWGITLVVVCLGFLFHKKWYRIFTKKINNEGISVLFAGVITTIIGAIQVSGFSVWTFDYRGLVTLLGWATLIKGIAIICIPGYAEKFVKISIVDKWYTTSLAILAIIGLYLLFVGFVG